MRKQQPLLTTVQEVENIFNTTYEWMKKKYGKYVSKNIIFQGEENYNNFVKLDNNNDNIVLTFSSYYINNTETKIKNVLKRYILTTNPDNTFKDYNSLTMLINRLKLFELIKTLQYNYLATNQDVKYNCFCLNCFNKYCIDGDVNNYQCVCGGRLHDNSPIYKNYSVFERK